MKYVFTKKELVNQVKATYEGKKRELFDEFFVFKAVDELVPITENDFNNFRDTVFDKFNRPGYLIYINKYYIFQPFDENEDVPMYYRSTYNKPMRHHLTLHNYIKNTAQYQEIKGKRPTAKKDLKNLEKVGVDVYDFESTMEYYDARDEFDFVGIVDKEVSRRRVKTQDELQDVFKIREKRSKILDKKRGTGIPSLKGAVCSTSKDKEYLEDLAESIAIKNIEATDTRADICQKIKERLLFLEKYSLGGKKLTYIMIPKNHPTYEFPYNLEDRTRFIHDQIKEKIKFKIDMATKTVKSKAKVGGKTENVNTYAIEIKDEKNLKDFYDFLKSLGGSLVKGKWIIEVK